MSMKWSELTAEERKERARQKKREKSKRYREKYREQIAARKGNLSDHEREQHRERCRRYRERHPDRPIAASTAWRDKNRNRINEEMRAKRKNDPERFVNNALKYQYGITLHQYNDMLSKQGGVCCICKKPRADGKRLAVDHNHTTGRVRGLLCDMCNRGLGYFSENTDRLRSAAEYLDIYEK